VEKSQECRICQHGSGKGKGTVHPRTAHEGPEGELRYSYTLSFTSALDGVGHGLCKCVCNCCYSF